MKRCGAWLLLASTTTGAGASEVVTDGTVGPAVNLLGDDIAVAANLGSRAGENLFHSFDRFSVSNGGSVTFQGDAGLRAIIARVTGGNLSQIDGLLSSTALNADVWLLNPAGFGIGPNAEFDVPQNLHFGTSDSIEFSDGSSFSGDAGAPLSLSVAPPETFGFLGAAAGAITIGGASLTLEPGKRLDLAGGELTFAGTELAIDGGELTLTARDDIVLSERASLRIDGGSLPGGSAQIEAGTLQIEAGGVLSASTTGANDAGRLDVAVGSLQISGDEVGLLTGFATDVVPDYFAPSTGLSVDALPGATGRAGSINIAAGEILLSYSGTIGAQSFGPGDAGRIDVSADTIEIVDGRPYSPYSGGYYIPVTPGGQAGDISLIANTLTLDYGGQIRSSSFGERGSGRIAINAENIDIRGNDYGLPTGIFIDVVGSPQAQRGNIDITTNQLSISQGARVSSSTFGDADAGDIAIRSDGIKIDDAGSNYLTGITSSVYYGASGNGGSIQLESTLLSLGADSTIGSRTTAIGNAGFVDIQGDQLILTDGGQISSSAVADAIGASGDVILDIAGLIRIDGQSARVSDADGVFAPSGIFASTEAVDGGPGGDVRLNASKLELSNRAEIASETFNRSNGGELQISAGTIVIDNAEITTNAEDAGAGGNATITAETVTLTNNASISATSSGTGAAGSVILETSGDIDLTQSGIRTASALAAGGEVIIDSGALVLLNQSEITTSVQQAGAEGDGGDIQLSANALVLNSGRIEANAVDGNGGNININVDTITPTTDSVVEATSELGVDGEIVVNGDEGEIGAGLVIPPTVIGGIDDLDASRCATSGGGRGSLVRESQAITRSPTDQLSALATSPTTVSDCQAPDTVQEGAG